MKILLKGAIIVVALVTQLTLINSVTILGLKPDLLMVVVVVFSLRKGEKEGTISGFASGLLQDIFSTSLLGINALAKTVIGFTCGILKEEIFHEHILFIIPVITFIASFMQSILIFLLLRAFGIEYNLAWSLKQIALPEALYSSLLSPFIFLAINKLFQMIKE
ncbi:rod shape-determining protein MreD [bacterium]|nr:rod shape-determining protein MreD [bacterium]MCG2762479.1 rod shape-determining protein MreD [Candidatus Atribacteria bacterium]